MYYLLFSSLFAICHVFSRTQIDAVEIHFAWIARIFTCSNWALQLHSDFNVILSVVTCWQVEILGQYYSINSRRVSLELRVIAIELLRYASFIHIIDVSLELARFERLAGICYRTRHRFLAKTKLSLLFRRLILILSLLRQELSYPRF